MCKRIIDIIQKFPQYEDIPYAGDFNCPNCEKSGFFETKGLYSSEKSLETPKLIGWCETNIGKMGVFECPVCHENFRFHSTIGTWIADEDEFDFHLYRFAKKCSNWEELKEKINSK